MVTGQCLQPGVHPPGLAEVRYGKLQDDLRELDSREMWEQLRLVAQEVAGPVPVE